MENVDLSQLRFAGTTKEACRSELAGARWSDSFSCRGCGHRKAYYIRTRKLYECANKQCKLQTSSTAGTQFHRSRSLEKIWSLFRESKETTRTLSKRFIMKIMVVSRKTAARAQAILLKSIKPEVWKKPSSKAQPDIDTKVAEPVRSDSQATRFGPVRSLPVKDACLCYSLIWYMFRPPLKPVSSNCANPDQLPPA